MNKHFSKGAILASRESSANLAHKSTSPRESLASPLSANSVLLTFCGANLHSAAPLIPTTVLFNFDVRLVRFINNVIGLSLTASVLF